MHLEKILKYAEYSKTAEKLALCFNALAVAYLRRLQVDRNE